MLGVCVCGGVLGQSGHFLLVGWTNEHLEGFNKRDCTRFRPLVDQLSKGALNLLNPLVDFIEHV